MSCTGLDQLRQFVDDAESESDDVEVVLVSASAQASVLTCRFVATQERLLVAAWSAEFTGVFESRLSVGQTFLPQEMAKHPLLADYVDQRSDLYFRGPPPDVKSAMVALQVAHDGVMGGWRPLSRYLNEHSPLDRLLSGQSGALASGPRRLMDELGRALNDHTSASVLLGGPAQKWNPVESRFEPYPPLLAVVGQDRYATYPYEPYHRPFVIAQSAAFRRVT